MKQTENEMMLSVTLPSIRTEKIHDLVTSLANSCTKYPAELIVCGPYPLPDIMNGMVNIKYIKDFGSPCRANQLAASVAEGKYITWMADDGLFFPNELDRVIDHLEELESTYGSNRDIVSCVYSEGANASPYSPDYFSCNSHKSLKSKYIPDSNLIINLGIMHRTFFDELGGLNCAWETCPMAHTDLGNRAAYMGANMMLYLGQVAHHTHMPEETGDHGPIHRAQIKRDEPLYRAKYDNPKWYEKETIIRMDNWKNSPQIWVERFTDTPSIEKKL